MEIALSIVASLLAIFVPGAIFLPYILSKRPDFSFLAAISIVPVISITINYLILYSVNLIGFYPNLAGVFTLFLALTFFALLRGRNLIFAKFNLGATQVFFPLLTLASTSFIWIKSYKGFNWIAPNQDGFNHNLYVARILDLKSVIGDHIFTASPLIKTLENVDGFYFYPLAWHASVTPAASLFGIPAPTIALSSTLVIWSFAMPLGLIALASLWFKNSKFIGIGAALLSQTIPLVPGVPMTWGAMASVIGIALIPCLLVSITILRRNFSLGNLTLTLFLIFGLFFMHPPEAMYLGVLLFGVISTKLLVNGHALGRNIAIAFFAAFLCAIVLFRSVILQQVELMSVMLGSAERSVNETLGSLLTMSINTTSNQYLFAVLLIVGIYFFRSERVDGFAEIAIVAAIAIYLVSGSNTWPLSEIRLATIPWFASYERTAWQLVPLVSLIAAIPIGVAMRKVQNDGLSGSTLIAGVCLALVVSLQTISGSIGQSEQIRKGLMQNQVAGPGSRTLFEKAQLMQVDGSYFLTTKGDGSLYAYMFNSVLVSNGAFDGSGNADVFLSSITSNLHRICDIEGVNETVSGHNLSGVIVGSRRYAWETAPYSKSQILEFKGFDIIYASEDLVLLAFNLDKCS